MRERVLGRKRRAEPATLRLDRGIHCAQRHCRARPFGQAAWGRLTPAVPRLACASTHRRAYHAAARPQKRLYSATNVANKSQHDGFCALFFDATLVRAFVVGAKTLALCFAFAVMTALIAGRPRGFLSGRHAFGVPFSRVGLLEECAFFPQKPSKTCARTGR